MNQRLIHGIHSIRLLRDDTSNDVDFNIVAPQKVAPHFIARQQSSSGA
jgi:hypothetical protein